MARLIVPILLPFIVIPIFIAAVSIFKYSGYAAGGRFTSFRELKPSIKAEIEYLYRDTIQRIADARIQVPPRITLKVMENKEGNTFNDPFLVGDTHEVHASYYVDDVLSQWCSNVISWKTLTTYEFRNRRIWVTFDCNRPTVSWDLSGIRAFFKLALATLLMVGLGTFFKFVISVKVEACSSTSTPVPCYLTKRMPAQSTTADAQHMMLTDSPGGYCNSSEIEDVSRNQSLMEALRECKASPIHGTTHHYITNFST